MQYSSSSSSSDGSYNSARTGRARIILGLFGQRRRIAAWDDT